MAARPESVWSIVCPGPSLDWSAIDPPGTVICVNRALEGATRCDWWVCLDAPNQEHERCAEDAARLRPKVVTRRRSFRRWQPWHGLKLELVDEVETNKGSWVQTARGGGPRYSFVTAVAFAAAKRAGGICFYGVDLAGYGYHTGPPGKQDVKNQKDLEARFRERWEADRKELDQVRRIYQAASERGIPMIGLPEHAMSPTKDFLRPPEAGAAAP